MVCGSGSGLGAERAQYNDDGIETSSFEPSAVHMASHDGATHLTIDDAVCETPTAPPTPLDCPDLARSLRCPLSSHVDTPLL